MIITILSILLFIPSVYANNPLYEIGIASGVGHISDYPASNQGRIRYIGFPTFKYRGEVFRSDKRGTRARFYQGDKTDIDLSFGASFPANSKDNVAREGMADLDWLGEIGPRLNIEIYHKHDLTIELELPMRYAFSTDFKFTKYRGIRFYPQLDFKKKINNNFRSNFSVKMNWATEELTDYFYEVSGSDINSSRPRFNAKTGYVGGDLSLFSTYNSENLFYIVGLRYSNYSQSTNENSPLFKSKESTSIFLALNYFFYKSKENGKN